MIGRSRVRLNDKTQPTGRVLAVLRPRGGGRGRPPEEDADPADPGESVPAVGGQQPGTAPRPLQGETRLCLPVDDDGPQPDVPRDRIRPGGDTTISWDGEPVPDHTTPVKHMQTIPYEWMDGILAPGRPPLPGRGWRGDRPAGRRQQRDGDHQVRGGRTSRQEGTRLYG